MKIIMENFNYNGYRFDRVKFELPQKREIDEVFKERILDYMTETLDEIIKFEKAES